MLEEPGQPETKTVVSCLCSNSVRSIWSPAQGAVSVSRDVVGDVRRQEGSTSSRSDVYRWAKIRVPEFRGGNKWSSYLVQFRTIMKMYGCDDNDIMVFQTGRKKPPATMRSNLKTIIQRVDESLITFAERTLRMAADGYS